MSLASNPNMAYAVAGRQARSSEKIHVHSHVRVPCAEAEDVYNGRAVYEAPQNVRRSRSDHSLSMKTAVLVAFFVLCLMVGLSIFARSKLTHISKQRQNVINEMLSTQNKIQDLQQAIAKAQDSGRICYEAAQRLGMVSSLGVTADEIYAPDTRPADAEFSLSASSALSSLPW